MNQEDVNLIKKEFNQDRNRWTDIILQRTFFWSDLRIKLAEREFQFILFLTTISIAFISIVLPLLLNSEYGISKITIFGFLIASLLGFIKLLSSLYIDRKEIPKVEKIEMDYFKKCQKLAVQIYGKIAIENVISEETKREIEEYSNLREEPDKMAAARKKEKNFIVKLLSIVLFLFLFSFSAAFISLFIELVYLFI